MTGPQQTRARGGVGASESAGAIDCSDYSGPLDVWLTLTGRTPPFAGNKATEWGNRLEQVIRQTYVTKHQVNVYVPPTSLWHPELPFVKAMPDGIVLDAAGAWSYVGPQCKNVGWRMAPLWDDGAIPQDYAVQGVVEMAVTGLPRIDFFVLIGGQDDREVTIWRDAELEADVMQGLTEFWRFVETDTQPPITGSKKFRSHLLGQIKRKRKTVVEATTADLATLERWREVAQEQKRLKREESLLKNMVLAELVARGGNKLASAIGAISIGNPRRKTAWKQVAEAAGQSHTLLGHLISRLQLLYQEPDPAVVSIEVDKLFAELSIRSANAETYNDLVARNTKVGEPGVRRPNDWTKNDADDESEGDSTDE